MKPLKIMTIEEQFMTAYDEYAVRILRYATGKVGKTEVAQDITSETFFKAWDYIRKGGQIDNMKSFCYKIANNLIIDYYRKKYRTDLPLETAENAPSGDQGVSAMEASSEARFMRERLAELPGDYGAILSYRYLDDLAIGDIARITGKSSANVYVIIHRALKIMRKKLQEENQ